MVVGSMPTRRTILGEWPSGKAPDSDSGMRRFDPCLPCHMKTRHEKNGVRLKVDGGRSSVGRVPDCDSGCRGFDSHRSPPVNIDEVCSFGAALKGSDREETKPRHT